MSSEPRICYISQALQLRANMAGSPDATNLPPADKEGIERVSKSAGVFRELIDEIDTALKKAEEAHTGRAAEAANASIAEIKPIAENAAKTAEEVSGKLAEQNQNQHGTFYSLPAEGGKLSDGRQAQMQPPDKNWAERHGVDDFPGLGWTSDYEDKQARFQATNDEAQQAMSRYNSQTANTTGSLPEFKPPDDSGRTGNHQGDYGRGAGEVMGGTSYGSGTGSAGTSSAWASAPSGAGTGGAVAAGASYAPSGSSTGAAPAGTGSAWSTPPGTVRGPDGTLYRQGSDGNWQRQNPYNGRWAPAPQGPPGGAGGGGARGGGAAPRGGAGAGGRAGGGFGPRGSGSSELAPGGRSGTGSSGSKGGGTTPTTAGGNGAAGGRGNGMMRGAGGAGGAQQGGGEEEEHERPSWLMETEDVFTNDMQRVAPPVIGETPYEQGN